MIKASDSKLKHCMWMLRMKLTWRDGPAVLQYNVILECAGCAGCQALECLHVCVCDWWVWERVCKYSVTQESNVTARGFLTGSIVVEGDMFSWGKARPVRSPPPTPQTLHPPTHPPPTHIHTRTLGTLLITIIALTVQRRRTEHSPAAFFFNQLYTPCLHLHMCVCVCEFCWKLKMNLRMIQCLWPWVQIPFIHHQQCIFLCGRF